MFRDGIHPFVQGRVQFGDDPLLPLRATKPKENPRFIDTVLYGEG